MSGVYVVYIVALCFREAVAGAAARRRRGPPEPRRAVGGDLETFAPPAFLITLVLGSIFAGWATPTEAAGVGCAGAMLLVRADRQFKLPMLASVIDASAPTNALVFFILFGATLFSYVFRALGGDDVVGGDLEAHRHRHRVGGADFRYGSRVLHGLLLRLDRNLPRRLAGVLAHDRQDDIPGCDQGQESSCCGLPSCWPSTCRSAFLTPPFGFALFYMKGTVPPSVTMAHIYRGIVPFVVIQLVRAGALHDLSDARTAAAARMGIPGLMEPFCLQSMLADLVRVSRLQCC